MEEQTKENLEKIVEIQNKISDLDQQKLSLKNEISDLLEPIKKNKDLTQKLAKIGVDGKFWNLRSRFNKDLKKSLTFCFVTDEPFRGRAGKSKKNEEDQD